MQAPVRVTLWLVFAQHLFCCVAASQPMADGGRSGALGGATTALDGDVWSRTNPAGRAVADGPGISFFASQGFGLAELRLSAATMAIPTRAAMLSLGAQTFGFHEYRENEFRAGLARGFELPRRRILYAGLDAIYHRVRIEGYGSSSALAFTAGLLARITPELWAGLAARNLNGAASSDTEMLERVISLGLMYRPYERIRVLADVLKSERFPWSFRAGVETQPVHALALRAGVATEPVRFTAGAGIRAGALNADVAAERHDVLGWTPGIALGVRW